MEKVKFNNQEYQIDCKNEMCGNCIHQPQSTSDQKCKLFSVILDHENKPSTDNSGWKRCNECVNAELR